MSESELDTHEFVTTDFDGEAAAGDPLFTQDQLRAWLAAQGLPLLPQKDSTVMVRKVSISIDPDGFVMGPTVDVEFYMLNEKGARYLLPVSELDAETNTRRPAVGAKRFLMHRDWKP